MNLSDNIADAIAHHGQFLMGVFPTKSDPGLPFIYTIGNALLGLPELLLIGPFPPETTGGILNQLGEAMRESCQPPADEVSVGGAFPVRCRWAGLGARLEYTLQAGRWLGHDEYAVRQVLFCDRAGIFPGEPGIEPIFDVPLP
jgi:hypothetical protein